MTSHLKYLFSCVLITTGLYSMDSQKELHDEIDIVHTCDLDTIRKKTSRERLKQHAPHYFKAALKCKNTQEIIGIFNTAINPKQSFDRQTFAHYVNERTNHNTQSFTGSYFLDTLIQNGKLSK